MEKIAFYKYTSQGNDFIIVDNWNGEVPEKDMAKTAKLMCRPKYGIGADGLVFIVAGPDDVDFAWRFFTADGTEADMCGNAARCAAHLAASLNIAPSEMSFKTKAGVVEATVEDRKVKIRLPKIGRSEGAALVEAEGISLTYHRLSVGMPHAVAWVEDLEALNVNKLGRAVRRHPAFAPDGANIDFAKVTGPDRLTLRSYMRGVEEEVLSSGTGAVAATLLAAAQGLITGSCVVCRTKGDGELTVSFEGPATSPEAVYLEGQVRCLFSGQVESDLFLK